MKLPFPRILFCCRFFYWFLLTILIVLLLIGLAGVIFYLIYLNLTKTLDSKFDIAITASNPNKNIAFNYNPTSPGVPRRQRYREAVRGEGARERAVGGDIPVHGEDDGEEVRVQEHREREAEEEEGDRGCEKEGDDTAASVWDLKLY